MAPSSGEETWPVSAIAVCACSAGGGANAIPTVKIAVVASHLPFMRIDILLGSVSIGFWIEVLSNPGHPSFRCLWHSDAGYPVCQGRAGLFWVSLRCPHGRPIAASDAGV